MVCCCYSHVYTSLDGKQIVSKQTDDSIELSWFQLFKLKNIMGEKVFMHKCLMQGTQCWPFEQAVSPHVWKKTF